MKWHFYKKQPTDPVRNPIGGEFFSTEAVKNITDGLVREAIQNSLDARPDNGESGRDGGQGKQGKARLRIFVSEETDALSPEKAERWFGSLWPHVMAEGNGLRNQPDLHSPCPFLVIEDFNTTGLTGDPNAHELIAGLQNHFLNFFRAEGHSDKSGEKGGSWGIGKNVFPRSSRINTYFGYTVRNDDREKLLLGRSILQFHHIGEDSFKSDGYWGEKLENGLIVPISDDSVLNEFRKDFNLLRREEPGLSIVVPWYDISEGNAISFTELAEAVVRGFFYPILKDILEVEICTPEQTVRLSVETLLDVVEQNTHGIPGFAETLPLIKMAQWKESVPPENFLTVVPPPPNRAQSWSSVEMPEDQLEKFRVMLANEERISIRVPMSVREANSQPVSTHFDVFIEKSTASHKPVFIRDELVIPDVKARSIPGVRSLVVANQSHIAKLLRLAETPAHTQWSASTRNFKDMYTFGPAAIRFVSESVSNLISIVNRSEQKPDPSLTIDYFSIPLPSDDASRRMGNTATKKSGNDPASGPDGLNQSISQFAIQPRNGGFSIIPGGQDWTSEYELDVRVSYNVRRGNPLKRYSTADFLLEDLREFLTLKNVECVKLQSNEMRIKIKSPDFLISLDGFDTNRDLYIKTTVVSS